MPTIWIIGDSTVEDNQPPFRGWGWALPAFVKEGVAVKNRALSGRSSRSFWEEGLFRPVAEGMRAGDMLLIQFGHNDEKDDERHTDPDTTFPECLMRYVNAAWEKLTLPVLITPVSRRFFCEPTSLMYTHGEYPKAIRDLAEKEGLPLCDLEKDSRSLYLSLGPDKTAELFVRLAPGENPDFPDGHDDKTHFNAFGAKKIAELVAEELKMWSRCADYLKA